MIPVVPIVKLTKAKYTKLYDDVSTTVQDEIKSLLDEFGDADKLYEHFVSKYKWYEICDEDELVFQQMVHDVYNEYHDYYSQLLTAYLKDIDIDHITEKSTSRIDTSSGRKDGGATVTADTTNRQYDLPNRTVDATSENGYLTGKNTSDNTSTSTTGESHSNTYGSTITSTDNREFVGLKKEYLAHIRDIYEEFTDKFSECFLHIY